MRLLCRKDAADDPEAQENSPSPHVHMMVDSVCEYVKVE
jgi:hypothetical protein